MKIRDRLEILRQKNVDLLIKHVVNLSSSVKNDHPAMLDHDFSLDNINGDANYHEDFSVDLAPLVDLDALRTPTKNLSFVDGLTEQVGALDFTPTPKKHVDRSSIIFPSPIRPELIYGDSYMDNIENNENVNPEESINQKSSQDGISNGINASTTIAISILKEKLKHPKDAISFDDLISKVLLFMLKCRWVKKILSECFLRLLYSKLET